MPGDAILLRILVLFVVSISIPSSALAISFSKLVDTTTTVPNRSSYFSHFSPPALDRDPSSGIPNAAFAAYDGGIVHNSTYTGIYAIITGNLTKIADLQTPVPGAQPFGPGNPQTFQDFGTASISGSTVTFNGGSRGNFSTPYQVGIFQGPGPLQTVANRNTLIPSGAGTFLTFVNPASSSEGEVAFVGTDGALQKGVYARIGGTLGMVADVATPIPGGTGFFSDFSGAAVAHATIDAQDIAFRASGSGGQLGIYLSSSGVLSVIADKATLVPGTGSTFTSLSAPRVSDGNVAFIGANSLGGGIFIGDGTGLTTVVSYDDAVPERPGVEFNSFGNVSHDSGNVAFEAQTCALCGGIGIYVSYRGSLIKVVDAFDTLEAKAIVGLSIGADALSGSHLAFLANFSDGSSGIYAANLPEPSISSLLLVSFAAWFLGWRNARGQRRR